MKTPLLALTVLFSTSLLQAGPACVSSIEVSLAMEGANLRATPKIKSEKGSKPAAPQPPASPSAPEPRREPPPARPAHLFM